MENDDYLPQGRSGFKVLLLMITFLLGGLGIAGWITAQKEATEAKERMYMACLDKLVTPEHHEFAAQLSSCRQVN